MNPAASLLAARRALQGDGTKWKVFIDGRNMGLRS